MRRMGTLGAVLVFVLSCATPLFAGPMDQLKGSVYDVISSPMELPRHTMEEVNAAKFKPFGLMGGILKGSFYTVKQFGTGIVDIVTLPLHLNEE